MSITIRFYNLADRDLQFDPKAVQKLQSDLSSLAGPHVSLQVISHISTVTGKILRKTSTANVGCLAEYDGPPTPQKLLEIAASLQTFLVAHNLGFGTTQDIHTG